jgi:hypothetical protein
MFMAPPDDSRIGFSMPDLDEGYRNPAAYPILVGMRRFFKDWEAGV